MSRTKSRLQLAAISESERPVLVTTVYAEEKIPDKPRNFIRMAKTLPSAEMEALIRASQAVTSEDLRALANQRASAVRNVLETEGKIHAIGCLWSSRSSPPKESRIRALKRGLIFR